MNLGDLNKVWEIKALKKAGQEEARSILERVAKLVQPIMRKHKWRVKLLSEFCPNNRSLLGLNVGGGVHVKLRLRRPNRDCDFFPFDQILDTMLHELCHNVHGPHNANFYKLWDEIRKECEDLMAKGISGSGEGFDLPGRRLGGFSRQPSLSSLRQTSLAAAEKRARMGSLLPSGPKRLGGDSSIMVALSPIQAAAMAAERRFQDDVWCGSELCEESGEGECSSSTDISKEPASTIQNAENAISRKRSHESNSSFVDLTTDNSVSQKRIHRTDNKSLPPLSQSVFVHRESGLTNSSKNASTSESEFTWNLDETGKTEEPVMWECATCTLLNPPLAPICELCSTHKPKDVDKKYKFWSCKFCTLENSVKLEKCTACGKWRYSHGSPVATRAPNLGT